MGRRFVIGDIHGCIRTFRQLVEEMLQPTPSDQIFLLGDYIDRGPDSKAVVDYIFRLQAESYKVIPLMGNHEYMLNRGQHSLEYFNLWMINSGFTTLRDFGVAADSCHNPQSIFTIPPKYLEFFRDLKIYEQTEGFFLCHGCFEGDRDDPKDDGNTMIWGRKSPDRSVAAGNRVLIHGHTPKPLAEIRKQIDDPHGRIINLDGGCVYRQNTMLGHLLALDLDSRELFVVKNSDWNDL
jgi:serine/threonine protein phosphatase 1